jgi:hypothetical protein
MSDLVNGLAALGLRHTAGQLDDVLALASKRRGARPGCANTSSRRAAGTHAPPPRAPPPAQSHRTLHPDLSYDARAADLLFQVVAEAKQRSPRPPTAR